MELSPDRGHGTGQEWDEAGWGHWRGTGGPEKGVVQIFRPEGASLYLVHPGHTGASCPHQASLPGPSEGQSHFPGKGEAESN